MNHEGHESHEAHDTAKASGEYRMRLDSPLPPDAERVMTETIGCAIAVHRALGPGFLESIYRKAMCLELDARHLPFERERAVIVNDRGVETPGQRVDLIIAGLIVVELKAVVRLDEVHRSQLIS